MKVRCAVFLLLFAASVISSTKMQNVFGRMPLCIMISIALFSLAHMALVYRFFSFKENDADKTCTRGREFHYKFDLVNDSVLFFTHVKAAFFNGCGQTQRDMAVRPHGKQSVEFNYSFKHIGKYKIGFLNARIYGPLDIFFIPYRNYRHEVLVLPRIESIDRFININENDGAQPMYRMLPQNSKPGELDAVRRYVPGDSLRRIHWKLTAHTGRYMSRACENPSSPEVSIFADLYRPCFTGETALSVFDAVVESALAAANCAVGQGCRAHIVFEKDKLAVTYDIDDYAELQKTAGNLALCGYDAADRVESLVDGCERTQDGFSNFVICTPNLDYDLACYITGLKGLGKNPMLFYIAPEGADSPSGRKITEYISNTGIDINKITV